jgi:hypothetical protein
MPLIRIDNNEAESFPLVRYAVPMYPPKVQDRDVQAVIRELAAEGRSPSGAAVRAALAERFGSRGGVARIYRLLANERARRGGTTLASAGMGLLEQENRNLRELLAHQRQREDAHQAHWNREIGQLRERVRTLEESLQRAVAAGEVNAALKREVEAAEIRTGQIEVQLRAFGPAAGSGKTER